jgi:predicted membrane metal-binding protein
LTAIALLVVAPIGAVVISVLLLFGVTPHLVFLPGFAVRAKLSTLGFQAPNAVGVGYARRLVGGHRDRLVDRATIVEKAGVVRRADSFSASR